MIVKPNKIWQGEMNLNNSISCPTTSSSRSDDEGDNSPLRSLLRSLQTAHDEPNGAFNSNISSDLFDITPTLRKKIVRKEHDRNPMRRANKEHCPLSLCLDKMALDGGSNHSIQSIGSAGVLPAGKDPDVFIQSMNCKQQPLMYLSNSEMPKELLSLPAMKSKKEKKEPYQKGSTDIQNKKESISFYTLNKLMERTASSRCLLLQQTKESSKSSAPMMRSLSASAFKTIVSSTTITSSTSAKSFRTTKTAPATFTNSDFINSSFDDTDYSQQKPKKPRMISGLEADLFGSKKSAPRRSEKIKCASTTWTKQKLKPMMNSLPSCGSLESEESESLFDEANQKSSSSLPLEIRAPVEMNPRMYSNAVQTNGFANTLPPSHSSFTTSSSLESDPGFKELIQSLSSSSRARTRDSFQTKRKFNSFQSPVVNDDRSSRIPNRGFSVSDLQHVFQGHDRKRQNEASGKISQTMKLKLRRELQRKKSKSAYEESSDYNWLL